MDDCVKITKEIIINGKLIAARNDFFNVVRSQLGEDVLIGGNLDALHDALTSISCPAEITVLNRGLLENSLENYWTGIYDVLMDCLDENPNLRLSFDEDDGLF